MNKIYTRFLTLIISLLFFGNLCAEENAVNIHGFISQGYMKTTRNDFIEDSKDGTFQFNEMGINFGHEPIEKLRIGLQFFARDMGSVGNDEITVDFAFADYRLYDLLGIRAGKMKNPMGLYSETRDVDMLRTSIMLPFSVYNELLRNSQTYIQGVGIYGDINTSMFGTFSYQMLFGTNNIPEDSADSDFLELGLTYISSVEMDTTQSYALQYSDPTGLIRIGGTACFTNLHVDSITRDNIYWTFVHGLPVNSTVYYDVQNIEIYTASVELTLSNWLITYEIKYTRARDLVLYSSEKHLYSDPLDQIGWYGMVSYRVSEFLEIGLYYDEFYPYQKNQKGHNPELRGLKQIDHWLKKWAFSCKIDINSNWLVKLETQYVDGASYLVYEDDKKEHWFINSMKVSYSF